jgi:dynamin 1-like protein
MNNNMSLMDKVYKGVAEGVSSLMSKPKSEFTHLSSPQVLEIGQAVNQIYRQNSNLISKKINMPEIVVVGTQSSGKSSVLNGILSMDLLPTGGNMVTRVPLNLSLIQTNSLQNHEGSEKILLEFGNYHEGVWNTKKQYYLTSPLPTDQEILAVRKMIESETTMKAGDSCNISMDEINIRIYSPHVPTLTLTDLPGLITVARTDQGQPADISDQIKKMVGKYISSPQSIILAVMASRSDLEADLGFGLVKEYDPNGQRTIGVLTKVDLMNMDSDISDYLYGNDNISSALKLKYGYYALRNRTNKNIVEEKKTPLDGRQMELDFFKKHSIYGQMISNPVLKTRFGIYELGQSLGDILTEAIKNALPDILKEILDQESQTLNALKELGSPIPVESSEQISYLHGLIERINREFKSALDEKGQAPPRNTGRLIKDHFVKYRSEVSAINPFDNKVCSDEYLSNIISNAEGNHMSFPTPPIEVLEHTLQDRTGRPIKVLLDPSLVLLRNVSQELVKLVEILLSNEEIARFPNLKKKFKDGLIQNGLTPEQSASSDEIRKLVEIEESYIWTDDPAFLNELLNLVKNSPSEDENQKNKKGITPGLDQKPSITILRKLLKTYFSTVQNNFQHNVPKMIMNFLVSKMKNKLSGILFNEIQGVAPTELLRERPEQETKRQKLTQQLKLLSSAREKLESF